MPLESLAGRAYGPLPFRVCSGKVAEYVLATGDDPARWVRFAPPAFAALALFSVAPAFLEDEEVAPYTRVLVHADQTFRWHLPWSIEEALSVRGTVERVRTRGESNLVTLGVVVDNAAGERVLDSASTFLMSSSSPDLSPEEEPEPPVEERGENDLPQPTSIPAVGDEVAALAKSASRSDLVRYAGASRDWNPIHFDHIAARVAGLPGMVVHGLLMAAWATQAGTRMVDHPLPLSEARFRFRTPLRPSEQAAVGGVVESDDGHTVGLKIHVVADQVERVGATMIVRKA